MSLSTALSAHAAGLGGMVSSSKLGEPLNAEIELLAVTPSELNSIQAALASEQVYQDQMLEKPASYPFIKIEVGNNIKGQPILKLTSSQPITEAFLDMLIQVDWPTGRLVKEYTLLLDPPGFNSNYVSESAGLPVNGQAAPAPSTPPAAVVPEPSQAVVPEAKKPASFRPAAAKPATKTETKPELAEETNAENALTTERGDTLYAIARQMKPDNVSVEQMLAALYQTNQQAFDGKNMNRLKVGKIMRMPDQATLDSISRPQAKSLIAEHATNWQAYKNSLAKVVQESAASQSGGNTQQSAGKIGAAGAKPAPQAKPGKDVLKLSAGDEKSTTLADKSAAKTSATAAQEDATAKANAIKEEQSRAAALEKQVADMKKLMEMKNNAMALAEKNAAQAAAEPKAEAKVESKVEPAPAVEKPVEAAPVEAAKVPPAPVAAEKPAAEPAKPVAPVETPAADEPVQQPSFMHVLFERLKNISPVLPLALIALPVLLCVWALIRIRRKKQIDTFEDAIVTSPATEMQNNTVFGDTQAAASGDTSFLTDFSQSGVGGMIDSHDVDPIAEAEVYMAYGRDAQAEEILKDAIQKDPERQELKVKLLEIYQTTGNKVAFESLAGEVYAKAGPADATWSKVSAMGQKLDPDNALYQGTPVAANEVTAAAESSVLPVTETQNEEDAYHFNFEAPALEFDGASEAMAAASSEPVASTESSARTATEEITIESSADVSPVISDSDTLQIDTPVAESTLPEVDDTSLAFSAEPVTNADSLRFEVEPASVVEPDSVDDLGGDALNEDADLALTPKALDLPSLNLDEGAQGLDVASNKPLSTTTGEQTLSSEDAVFESLPELSLELGGPNDAIAEQAADDALEIEEISLGAADTALNEAPVVDAAGDNVAFPEISLDMADSASVSTEAITDEPEEVNTKLDLIQAYIDMEDVVGAKELIDEVIAEGGERQRQRASELLAKLA
nr:FimV/HubP family polar landmark protein [Methylophilus sp. 14]